MAALKPRKDFIKRHQLPRWYKAVTKLKNPVIRDFLLLCLFTGLRRTEATQLRWADIDMEGKTLRIPPERTKNHEEHVLPLSDFLCKLLDERIRQVGNPFVFPGKGGTGHLIEMKRAITNVTKASGVTFKTHYLRRTFITIAEGIDIPHYALKKLLNHKTNDSTSSYN